MGFELGSVAVEGACCCCCCCGLPLSLSRFRFLPLGFSFAGAAAGEGMLSFVVACSTVCCWNFCFLFLDLPPLGDGATELWREVHHSKYNNGLKMKSLKRTGQFG